MIFGLVWLVPVAVGFVVVATAAAGAWWAHRQGLIALPGAGPVDSGTLNGWRWEVRKNEAGFCAYTARPGFGFELLTCQPTLSAAKGLALEHIHVGGSPPLGAPPPAGVTFTPGVAVPPVAKLNLISPGDG